MKVSAIIRIIAFSLLFLILLGILLGGLCIGYFLSHTPSGETTTVQRELDAAEFSNLEIDWAAGSVKIMTGDSDTILIKETRDVNNPYTMSTEFDETTLKISYGSRDGFSLSGMSGKDLVIVVPSHWACYNLEIDGAALDIEISNIFVDSLKLDGAALDLSFTGTLWSLEADGAAVSLDVNCSNTPNRIDVDGVGCQLALTLPAYAGFRAKLDGLGVSFRSDFDYTSSGGAYCFGNENCKINVEGLGCQVRVDPS